jgi:hypothetical protein
MTNFHVHLAIVASARVSIDFCGKKVLKLFAVCRIHFLSGFLSFCWRFDVSCCDESEFAWVIVFEGVTFWRQVNLDGKTFTYSYFKETYLLEPFLLTKNSLFNLTTPKTSRAPPKSPNFAHVSLSGKQDKQIVKNLRQFESLFRIL